MYTADHLIKLADKVFHKRFPLLSMWQDIAENFYPERANFTRNMAVGDEYQSNLLTSYPILVRRDLGDSLSSMLRPTSKAWMHMRTRNDWEKVGTEARAWLENAEHTLRRAMYHSPSQFVRATKEADHDFATFGQAAIRVSLSKNGDSLLFKTYHLRDVAWLENEDGIIDTVFCKWKPTAGELVRLFGDRVHREIIDKAKVDPYCEVEVMHVAIPTPQADHKETGINHPFRSLYIDVKNQHVMEDVGARTLGYVIPRWRTVSGSQYAVSPATCIALPDARLLQGMVDVLLEAGEKAVNPPMVANKEVFTGDVSIYAGGITWADYTDGRLSDHYDVMRTDRSGIPFGMEMTDRVKNDIANAFYISKLTLPPAGVNMTAYEVGQRVQEYIRQAMPLFEPIEDDYNSPLCEEVFNILLRRGTFGSPFDMPKELHGADIQFMFESPLHDAIEAAKAQKFAEVRATIAETTQLDPTAIHVVNFTKATRDSLQSSGTPADWLRSETEVQRIVAEGQQKQAEAESMAQAQQAAQIVKDVGNE